MVFNLIFLVMKLQPSSLLSEMSGSLNGSTLQKNKTGLYMRTKPIPSLKLSNEGWFYRAMFSNLANMWRSLTISEQQTWPPVAAGYTFYDRFGNAYKPSPFQVFMALNLRVSIRNYTYIREGQSYAVLASITAPVPTFYVSTQSFVFTIISPVDDSLIMRIFASRYYPQSTSVASIKYTFLGYSIMDDTPIESDNLYDRYVSVFGVPPVGSIIYCKLHGVDSFSGQETPPLTFPCSVAT